MQRFLLDDHFIDSHKLTVSFDCFVLDKWHKPKISARRLADLRKQYIAQGYYWPEKPMVDRGLDRMPKGHKYEKRKEERCVRILSFYI